MDVLERIISAKNARLTESKRRLSFDQLRARALEARVLRDPHRLLTALNEGTHVNVIAEIKRASPSKGLIRGDIEPAELGRAYENGGAAAISVLTEEDNFQGCLADLLAVGEAVSLPLLRKDFIFEEYQVYESAAAGADALLLIVAALDERLEGLRALTEDELGMDALVEVHTDTELERAAECGTKLIGVNNRDLRSFEVSLETSARLAPMAPRGAVLVSESGIESGDEIRRLRALGYQGFLVGESLLRAADPGRALRELISESEPRLNADLRNPRLPA